LPKKFTHPRPERREPRHSLRRPTWLPRNAPGTSVARRLRWPLRRLVIVAPRCELFWTTGTNPKDPYLADDSVRGHVERLWILDVEGGRIVVEASHEPGATEEQVAELTGIVESVRFTDTE
jgi:hypothetical protein